MILSKIKNSLFLVAISFTAYGQSIDSLVKLRVDRGETPGIVVGIYENGKTTFYTAGYADPATKEKVTSKTLFEIGSVTKTFTTLMAAEMIDHGIISLDDPIQKFLPKGVKVPEKDGKQITVETLASARSGLPRMPNNFNPADQQNPYIDYNQEKLFDFLNQYSLLKPPGYGYEYSNLGMGFLGYTLTLKSHKPYSQMLEEMVTHPLGMAQTFLNSPSLDVHNAAKGYNGTTPVHAWTWTNESVLAGAGGIISNAEDMLKYVTANLNEAGPLGRAMAMTHVSRHDAGSEKMQIGMGWHILNRNIVWHNGGTGGFRSFTGFNPQTKTALIILTNSNTGADDLGFHLLDNSLPLKTLRVPVAVDEKSMKLFVGEYELSTQFKIVVTYKDGSLFGQATGQPPFEMFPESGNKFFLKVVDAQIEFLKNDKGVVEKLLLYQNGVIQGAKKVK